MNESTDPQLSAAPSVPVSVSPILPASLTFGQLLDRVFRLVRTNFKLFMGIASVPTASMVVLYALMLAAILSLVNPFHPQNPPHIDPATSIGLSVVMLLSCIPFMLVYALYEAATSHAALQADLSIRVTVREAWARAWDKAGRYTWLMVLRILAVMAPIALLGLLVGGGTAMAALMGKGQIQPGGLYLLFPLLMLLYVCALVYIVLAMLWLALSYSACVAEGITAWASIRRSLQLTRGVRGKIFLVALVIYAISYAAILVLELVVFAVGAVGMLVMTMLHLNAMWGYVALGAAALLLLAAMFLWMAGMASAYSVTFAVIYHEQRRRLAGPESVPTQA